MSKLRAVLAGGFVLSSGAALAHTTEMPHAHPHIMDLSVGSSLLAVALFSVSIALLLGARHVATRRRK